MLIRRSLLKRIGPQQVKWKKFRDEKFNQEKNNDGTITCQDYLIGLPRCSIASSSPDLHHIVGRSNRPDLYYADQNLVWLARLCHQKVHQ